MDIGQPTRPSKKVRRPGRLGLSASTALSQRFEFETLEPRVLMSADLLPVHGAIDVPGQTNHYTFSLTDATQLYFDSQTPHSNSIDWSLTGPRGVEVTNQSMEYTDGYNNAATLSLPSGDYSLSVSDRRL
jgi:hypothetical protein